MADLGEGPRGGGHPSSLIFRPNWGPKGWKVFFWRPPPIISGSGWPPPPLLWRSGSATAYVNSSLHFVMKCMKSWLAQDSWDKGLTLTLDIIKWGLKFLLLPNTGCLQLLTAGLIQLLLYSIFSLVFLFVLKDWWSKGLLLFRRYVKGTQREYSSKPLKYSIVERILAFKR